MPTAELVTEPFPIYTVNGRYMLFDVNVVSHVRANHHMCGCLSGTLPQIPQQNVFLGLPLELMLEEAALLVESGAAYIVDDAAAHKRGLGAIQEADRARYLKERDELCLVEALAHQKGAEERKAKYARDKKQLGEEMPTSTPDKEEEEEEEEEEESLLNTSTVTGGASTTAQPTVQSLLFYPISTTSPVVYHSPLPASAVLTPRPNPSSYPLYKYLHAAGYFLSPGLRFGCQFVAYPGDPLRFHSHFITRGLGWDEEIDLIDIVGGGRLGTGVKKAWMFGGKSPEEGAETRVFCVEWGGF